MSTSSVRRIKERGGGEGKITAAAAGIVVAVPVKPTKTLTPVGEKSISGNGGGAHSLRRSASGKENPRPISRPRAAAAQQPKPTIRAMPRIDKSSAVGSNDKSAVVDPRARWSTSSVPRGRSPSPSEFTRVLSDMKRSARASLDRPVQEKRVNSRVLKEKSDLDKKNGEIGKQVPNDSQKSENFLLIETKPEENEQKLSRVMNDSDKNDGNLSSSSIKSKDHASGQVKVKSFVEKSVELGSKGAKMANKSGGFSGVMKEKCVSDGCKSGVSSVNKYPSKLHEKLAFLEGKVKRIASDIKRTKEMLDMNNPDASKVVLSDIQEKISGIEKAMSNVVNGDNAKDGLVKGNESEGKVSDSGKWQEKQVLEGKSSVKGLSVEELEARLLPHHKLLRDRTSVKSSSVSCQIDELKTGESTSEVKAEEKSLAPIEDNPIALEFLASLGNERSQVSTMVDNASSEITEVQETDGALASEVENSSNLITGKGNLDIVLTTSEKLEEFDDQENRPGMIIEEETENTQAFQLNEIGQKTSTGGWFVSEGESVLLAHNDGSCTFYDIANCEGKAEFKPPAGISPNMWRDCWIVRAPGADGCSGRYVVAASAGNSVECGFCSWDFYTKEVRAFHVEDGSANIRTALADLPNNTMYRRNALPTVLSAENQQWWYKPCGPLIVSTASCQKSVKVYDIRDGDHIMKWELQKPVTAMDYSSPLQWRNRGKVVIAEAESISLWDVSSLNPQALVSVTSNRKISALHVNNTDAELGGGVRQRVSSSEVEGNDGVFCTPDSINVLDFRQPSGIGLRIPKVGVDVQSTFSRGDSIFIGCTSLKSVGKKQFSSQVQQFSLRKQGLFSTYMLPQSDAHFHYKAITQVWGNSSLVMGVSGLGLHVFDPKDEAFPSFSIDNANVQNVRDVIGPDDLYSPSFDYLASRVLLISRDRPAMWRYLS